MDGWMDGNHALLVKIANTTEADNCCYTLCIQISHFRPQHTDNLRVKVQPFTEHQNEESHKEAARERLMLKDLTREKIPHWLDWVVIKANTKLKVLSSLKGVPDNTSHWRIITLQGRRSYMGGDKQKEQLQANSLTQTFEQQSVRFSNWWLTQ